LTSTGHGTRARSAGGSFVIPRHPRRHSEGCHFQPQVLPHYRHQKRTCPVGTEGGTRRVQLVRKEGRDVSCWYGREEGGGRRMAERTDGDAPATGADAAAERRKPRPAVNVSNHSSLTCQHSCSLPEAGRCDTLTCHRLDLVVVSGPRAPRPHRAGWYGGRDAACPVSTGGGTRRVRSARGSGGGPGRDLSGPSCCCDLRRRCASHPGGCCAPGSSCGGPVRVRRRRNQAEPGPATRI